MCSPPLRLYISSLSFRRVSFQFNGSAGDLDVTVAQQFLEVDLHSHPAFPHVAQPLSRFAHLVLPYM